MAGPGVCLTINERGKISMSENPGKTAREENINPCPCLYAGKVVSAVLSDQPVPCISIRPIQHFVAHPGVECDLFRSAGNMFKI